MFLFFQFQVADSNKIPKYVCIYVLRECCLRCKLGGYACTTYGHLQSLHCFLFQSKNIASMHACAVHTIWISRPIWIYTNSTLHSIKYKWVQNNRNIYIACLWKCVKRVTLLLLWFLFCSLCFHLGFQLYNCNFLPRFKSFDDYFR